MDILALIITVSFVLLGLLHFYWAAGGKAGVHKVIPTIDGKPSIEPGKIIIALVGAALVGIGAVSYLLGFVKLDEFPYGKYIVYAGWLLSVVFVARAVGDFKLVGFFKKHKTSGFAEYDTKYYSPFFLLVSASFVVLSYSQA